MGQAWRGHRLRRRRWLCRASAANWTIERRGRRPELRPSSALPYERSLSVACVECGPACAGRAFPRLSTALTPGQRRSAAEPP